MRKFLGKGECQKCGAKEVIAHVGHRRLCGRCDERQWQEVSDYQKSNYMSHGSVYGEKKFAKNAKSFGNSCKNT
jgi:ribosomal protein S27AE